MPSSSWKTVGVYELIWIPVCCYVQEKEIRQKEKEDIKKAKREERLKMLYERAKAKQDEKERRQAFIEVCT